MQTEVGNLNIGVLSLQGGVIEHMDSLRKLGVQPIEVKKACELNNLHGLILPGGESTTLGNLLRSQNILNPLREKILNGFPVWGTCAGMILLAKKLCNDDRVHIQVLDVEVKRNGYGPQLNSFKTEAIIPLIDNNEPVSMVFIRAPFITKVLSPKVNILSQIDNKIVAVRQGNMLATSFHPELSDDLKFHNYFLNIILQNRN